MKKTQLSEGLESIRKEIDAGAFSWSVSLEDVHMNIEAALTQRIGSTGKKLHTGRSRNDQVATDIRLYLRAEIDVIAQELTRLQTGLVDLAKQQADTIMPGFTHLQTAQPGDIWSSPPRLERNARTRLWPPARLPYTYEPESPRRSSTCRHALSD